VITVNVNERLPAKITARETNRSPMKARELAKSAATALQLLENGDFSELERLVHDWDRNDFKFSEFFFDKSLWDLFVDYAKRMNGDNSFADLYWTWQALFQTTARLLRAPLPEADVYHVASTGYAGLYACLAKIRTGKPFVVSEHGLYLQERQMELAFHSVLRGAQR
jgi:hypothetical protein